MPRSSPSSSEGPGFAGVGELRTCIFSTNTIPGCPVQSDVADAFFNVPLHSNVWPLFFCRRFFSAPDSVVEHFYLHTSADFGAAGMPGIFRLLCVRCVVLTARAAQVLTLPMAVYVDGNCLMGPCRGRVGAECIRSRHGCWTFSPSHRHALHLVARL